MAVRRVNAQTRSLLAVNQISTFRFPLFPLLANDSARDTSFDVLIPPMPQSGNAKIVFTSNRDGLTQIYAMNVDGSNQTRLTNSTGNDDSPRWSPNGARILFQSDRDHPDTGYMDIYVMNADGSGQTRLTTDANDDSMATWSADGTKIAFQSMRNGINYQVYSMNADGSNQVCLTNTSSSDGEPSWSPNGTKIAFASDRDHAGYDCVYVMNTNGSGQQRLTTSASTVDDTQPVWSRDGSRIAFVSTRDSVVETWQETDDNGNVITKSKLDINKEVYVMSADGSGQTRLTNDLGNDDEPSWSPDGSKIIFRSDRQRDCCDPSAQVWMMNPDGSSQTDLSSNGVGDYNASWTSGANQPPVANAGGPYNGVAGQGIQFNGGGSFDPDGSIASYAWNFGDGGTGSGAAPFHTYATAGTYNVVLTVTDNLGAQGSASTTATVATPNQPPVANAGGPYSGNSGTSIQYNGSASYDPDGTIATYQWSFGDGANGAGMVPAHTYSSAGTYSVTLTVTDNRGATATASANAVITSPSNQPPVADFGGPYSAVSGTPVQFNGTGSYDPDGTITQYQWSFADGTASGASPTHTFAAPGSHLVTLTVTDNGGATNSRSFNLMVAKPGGIHPESDNDVRWDPTNRDSLDDPINRRGVAPNTTTGNNNFQIVAPVLSVPGRGLNLSLNLTYNSLVWNKSTNEILFDIDHDSPAPGWQLGLGKMVMMGTGGAMIMEPDGTRHPFSGKVDYYTYPAHPPNLPPTTVLFFKGQTTDGSNIEYRSEGGTAVARYPNGTVVHYNNYTGTIPLTYLYPSTIMDTNGNAISISYQPTPCDGLPAPSTEPRIQRIVDTVGRVFAFHYDSQNRLTSITGPGLSDPHTWSQGQTFVRIHYKTQTLNLSGAFSGLTPRVQNSNSTFSAIDAIYYPATGKGYWFGGDAYSTYGMITKVAEERGMTFTAGSNSNEQGTISEGTVTRQQTYDDYPSSPSGLTAAPSFTHQTESWDGGPSNSPVTAFLIEDNPGANEHTTTITNPDGTKTIQKAFNFASLASSDPNKFKDGLMKEQQALDSTGRLLLKTVFTWEKGANNAPHLTRTEATDELGQLLATNYDQYGTNNSVGRTREYDYDGATIIRTTRNTFLSYLDNDLDQGINPGFGGISLIHPRRVNLVDTTQVFAGDDSSNSLKAQTAFKYDEYAQPLQAYTPDYSNGSDLFACAEPRQPNGISGILQHSGYFNPMPPNSQNGGGSGDQYITKRGNVTSITRYADTSNSSSPANPITETRTYDMAGNVITASRACCEQMSSVFDLPRQYAFAISQTSGSADSSSLLRVTTSATSDLNTGLPSSKTDANGRPTSMSYYPDSLRPKEVISPTGSRIKFEYDDLAMKVTQTTRLSDNGTIASQTVKYLNGAGQVRREEALGVNGVVDIVETTYDQFGRLSQQSRPYRSGETPQWTTTVYDPAGRVSTTSDSSSSSLVLFNEATRPSGASTDFGQTTRTIDAWGRWRWSRLNSSGKLAEVVEPNATDASASGYQTRYIYDALNNLVRIEQGDQVRRFRYDSLGRLTQQKLAEASATLNDAGTYLSSGGTWSDVFTYDARSNMISHTDARGVKTLFSYKDTAGNDDPLNRLLQVSYDTSGVDASSVTVLAAPTISYQYRTKPSAQSLIDVTQVRQIVAANVSTEDVDFDGEGRVQEKRFTFNGRSQPMTTTYGYDTLGRVNQITYPEQYLPSGSALRKVVTPSYDVASRMDGLKVNGVDVASQIDYNAASQIKTLTVGTGSNQAVENYAYDAETGFLMSQNVQRNGATLMSLSYGYAQNYCFGGVCPQVVWPHTGQITRVDDETGTKLYSYDAIGRLSSVRSGSFGSKTTIYWSQNYTYDRYGNRLGVTASGTAGGSPVPTDGQQSLSYDSTNNRITNSGFSYDPAGNQLTNGTGQSFIYDAAGRLAKVKDQNNATVSTYTYGASNHRLITQTGNESSPTKTYYVWEGDSVITEYTDPSGASMPQWSKNYVYFGARLLATEEPNGSGGEIVSYHHPDRLGTRLVTNNANTTVIKQATLPFGTALEGESSGVATNRRFTSYDRNATTGLDYAVNRQYDSRQGRFTQPDPLGLAAASLADPQSLNMYSYVGNDPMNRVDPDGQFWGALLQLIIGLFHNLKPNIINGSFAYHNHPPISVSFTPNFQNIFVAYGSIGFPIREIGHWLPDLLKRQKELEDSKRADAFQDLIRGWTLNTAYEAAREIFSTENRCSQFFGGSSTATSLLDMFYSRLVIAPLSNPRIGIQQGGSNSLIPVGGGWQYLDRPNAIVNSNGIFFHYNIVWGSYVSNSLAGQLLQIYHDLAHNSVTPAGTKLILDDGNIPLLSGNLNTAIIVNRCQDQIRTVTPLFTPMFGP